MKRTLLILLFLASPAAVSAQTGPAGVPPSPPGLRLDELKWVPAAPISYDSGGGGPAAHPTVSTDRTGSRVIGYRGGAFGPGSGLTQHYDSIWRTASVRATNTGTVAIKYLRLDYVFTDPATGAEVLRVKQVGTRRKGIKPGKSRVYWETMNGSKRVRRGDDARMSVEVREVVYADKTVWRRP
jgi:hypothetical protein